MRLAVANLKGGVTKTTSAVFLAAALARHGPTLLVDADPTGSALSWSSEAGDFPITVIGLAVKDIAKRLTDLGRQYEHVVMDTPPLLPALVRAAVLAADMVLIPVAPTAIDLDRIRATLELIAEVEAQNAPAIRILIAKARAGTASRQAVRDVLDGLGVPLMTAEIPLRERYAQAWGTTPNGQDPDYGAVLAELLNGRGGHA